MTLLERGPAGRSTTYVDDDSRRSSTAVASLRYILLPMIVCMLSSLGVIQPWHHSWISWVACLLAGWFLGACIGFSAIMYHLHQGRRHAPSH